MSKQTSISDITKLLQSFEDLSLRFNKLEKEVIELRSENKTLRKENMHLKQENETLRNENKTLRNENKILRQENKVLLQENKRLKERVSNIEHKKNSTNSSKTPSCDIIKHKRTQSLRKSSGKKVGGQAGNKGTTLKMTDIPDQTKDYYPDVCKTLRKRLI